MGSPGYYTTGGPIATEFPGHECMDDLTDERSFDSQVRRIIDVFGLFVTFYPWESVQPVADRRPAD